MSKSALEVARRLLTLGDSQLTHLQLQKLLYFVQGYSLALFDKPMFSDQIEAWRLGPVVRKVFDEYKGYGAQRIEKFDSLGDGSFSADSNALIQRVFEVFGPFNGGALSEITHREGSPWHEIYEKQGCRDGRTPIPEQLIKDYFKAIVQKTQQPRSEHADR